MPTNVQAQEFLQTLSPFAFTPAKKQEEQKARAENEKSERVVSGLGAQLVNKVRIIDSNMTRVAVALGKVVSALSNQIDRKAAYSAEEAQIEAVKQQAALQQQTAVKEDGPSFGSVLKSLFTNPAFIGALATVAYSLLPQNVKDRIKLFLKTFRDEVGLVNVSLSELHPAIKAAGVAIATYFTVSLVTSLAGALANVIRLSKFIGTVLLPKGAGNAARTVVGAVALGAAAVVGTEVVKDVMGVDNKAPGAEPGSSPSASPEATKSDQASSGAQKASGPGVAASSGQVDIKKYVKFNSSVDLDGLDSSFKDKFAAMAMEYEKRTGRKIQVNSAYRDSKKQAELYKKLGPGKASRPGTSLHEKGLAIDIQSYDASRLAKMGLLEKYGFTRPYTSEPWHIEPIGASTGGTEDNPVKPGRPVLSVGKSNTVIEVETGRIVPEKKEKEKDKPKPESAPSIPSSTINEPPGSSMEMEGFGNPYGSPSSSLEPSQPVSGNQIAALSTSVDSKYTPAPSNNVVPINNSKTSELSLNKPTDSPPPVPNPVADRGSLGMNTTHSTSYG